MPQLPALVGALTLGSDGPDSGLESAGKYARAATSQATLKAYATDLFAFRAWCATRGVVPVPATEATVAGYLSTLADAGFTSGTIGRRAAAIAWAHRKSGHDSPTSSEAVKEVLSGIRQTLGTAAKGKAPATIKVIEAMLAKTPTTLTGQRDHAILALCFAAALRRSEVVALDLGDVEITPKGLILFIRRSKTDQEGAGQRVAVPNGKRIRPVEAVRQWLTASGISTGPLFRSINKAGRLGDRLSDRSVANIVKAYAKRAGLDPDQFAGHSLRSGFVTSALESGADVLNVMRVTRHREVRTLQSYDRRARAFEAHAGQKFL
jgi:site-specific recombinase XerD